MKFNRIFALSLSAALALSLTACGKKADAPTPAPTDTPAVSESVQPSEAPTPSAEPTVEPSLEPEASKEPVQSHPIETLPVESAPADNGSAADLSAEDVWNAVSAGRELPDFMDLDDGLLSDLYGIDAADLDSYVAKVPMINVKATEFFIAKVKSGKMDAVKAGIAKRQADLDEQWSMYLPDQLELVQNYKLSESGDYVLFAIYEDADDVVKAFEDCVK